MGCRVIIDCYRVTGGGEHFSILHNDCAKASLT
jgi:hypothetical protein